ncbi:MAG: helix-hairpin-helix domain-containing protein [Thermoanaerobaculales bacterium]|jgi:DNA polymerase (family 10)|nr:helix-hairpin-helix domain-containing protein [Thermoanaerobaculales bacterium]
MDRRSAADALRSIARLLEVQGANPHRVRAFSGAARAVERASGDLAELVESGRVLELPGVGKGTAAVLGDLAAGRRPAALVEAESAVPPGVREMLELAGLGPKKVRALWQTLGVETVGELEYACRENRLVELTGFGPTSQAAVLEAVVFHRSAGERRLLPQARAEAEAVLRAIEGAAGVRSVALAGELRRGAETVGELAFVVDCEDPDDGEAVARVVGRAERLGDRRWLCRPESGLAVQLWLAPSRAFGDALIRATGDEGFVAALEARVASGEPEGTLLAAGDEAAVLRSLGLAWIPPELRDGARWIELAASGRLPALVGLDELRGVLHNHTTDSDGAATLEEMAEAAARRGWSFFGVADHSPAATYAHGVDATRLRRQWARADAWNRAGPGLRVVKGLEADILADGRLDLPDGCADGLDYVVASVHSSFRLSEDAQTARIIEAIRHPACRVLGHPTGRLLLARPGYAVDLERVLDACAAQGVAVEVNASPYRLDLDAVWARRALDRGLRLAVNPDAHSVDGLDDVAWGLTVVRRAGATPADLVNCMELSDFLRR